MKKEAKNKKITNEELANLVTNGFKSVNKKFNGIDKKFDRLESYMKRGFESLDAKIEGVQEELEGVKNQLVGTNKRVDDFAETKATKFSQKELVARVEIIEEKLEIKK